MDDPIREAFEEHIDYLSYVPNFRYGEYAEKEIQNRFEDFKSGWEEALKYARRNMTWL